MKKLQMNELKGAQVLTRSQLKQVLGGATSFARPCIECNEEKPCPEEYVCRKYYTPNGPCTQCVYVV